MSSENNTKNVIDTYYACWTRGTLDRAKYDASIAEDVCFRGSIDSHDGRESYWHAVEEFTPLVDAVTFHSKVIAGNEAFCLYDIDTKPLGKMLFAEHFTVEDGRITDIRLVFDSIALRPLMAQARAHSAGA